MKRHGVRIFALAVLLAGCDPFHTGFEDLEDAHYYEKKNPGPVPGPKPVLRAMSYNVKFGGGRIDFFFDCFGDRVLMSKDEVLRPSTARASCASASRSKASSRQASTTRPSSSRT